MSGLDAALILDFGGVITRTLFETHRESERALGLAPGTLTWRGPFDLDSDALWRDMAAGRLSERDYWHARAREVGSLLGEDWTEMSDLVRRARGDDADAVIRPEAVVAIDHAKAAGCKLALLSNEIDLFYGKGFRAKVACLHDFDVIHDATYTQVLKPDPRAYLDCCAALGLEPQVCVFVDDQPRNVAGAEAVGMRAVRFDVQAPEQSFAAALALLGLDLPETIHA